MSIKVNKKNKSTRVELIRVGRFERRYDDDLDITLVDLQKMKQNFESNARRQTLNGSPVLPFNFGHNPWDEAAGWITELDIGRDSNNFDALFAAVDWSQKGAQKIRDDAFKFVSSEFSYNFKDPETGKIYDIILGGAALTNIPFIRDMEAVELLSENENGRRAFVSLTLSGDDPDVNLNQGVNMPNWKKILEELESVSAEDKIKLSEAIKVDGKTETKKLSEELVTAKKDTEKAKADLKLSEDAGKKLKEEMSGSDDAESRIKLAENKIKEQDGKITSLVKTLAENTQKAEFDKMLLSGKVCEAQRESFMKQDFVKFSELAQAVKLDESGRNSEGDETVDANLKVEKLAEEKMKDDKDLSYGQATSMVLSENPKLSKQLGYED